MKNLESIDLLHNNKYDEYQEKLMKHIALRVAQKLKNVEHLISFSESIEIIVMIVQIRLP